MKEGLSLSPTPIVVVVVVVVFFRNASFVVERRREEKGLLPLSLLGGCEIHRKKASPEGGEEFHFCSFLGDGYRESEMGFSPHLEPMRCCFLKKDFPLAAYPSRAATQSTRYFQRVRGPSFPSCFREAPVARMATRGATTTQQLLRRDYVVEEGKTNAVPCSLC